MAINLTKRNTSLSKQISINPQAILKIEGLDTVFGAQPVLEFIKWDAENVTWDVAGANWDGLFERNDSLAVISLGSGTTNSITNQILPDKGGTTNLSTVNISMVDVGNKVAKLLSFDNITEILGKKADFYIGFKQGSFPEDALPIFRGIITDFYTQDGLVMVTVAHPETLKVQEIYDQYLSPLTANISAVDTVIPVAQTEDYFESIDALTSYIKIGDEIMLVGSKSSTTFTVTRAQFGTIAVTHDDEDDVTSVYELEGKPIPLALKLMLSGEGNEFFLSDDIPKSINYITNTESLANSLIFEYFDIQDLTGLVVGDSIRLTGPNAGIFTIKAFGTLDNGSFITVNESLIEEVEFLTTFEYRSQFNVLPDGLGMQPFQVDIAGHLEIQTIFPSNFTDYRFVLNDTLSDPKEFIDKELYFPQALIAIPRKARSSVKMITPPFTSEILPTLNVSNITNLGKIKQRRSTFKYLYNIYRYNYEKDEVEDKFKAKTILINNKSRDRIKIGKKQLKINSLGLRNNPPTTIALSQIIQRMKDRYSFAPTYLQGIQIKYSDSFNLEVGDVIPFGGLDSQVVNLQTGKRGLEEKLYEIINKSLNIKTGEIKVDLLETSFNLNTRNAVFSLASFIGSNSTTTSVNIFKAPQIDTGEFLNESDKWVQFVGQEVRVRNDDYTNDEVVTFVNIDPANNNNLIVTPALTFTPSLNDIIEIPEYDDTSSSASSIYKLQFSHMTSLQGITSVASDKIFDVADGSEVREGSFIYVHSDDFTRDSFEEEIEVASVVGNTVTLDVDLPFTPLVGDKLQLSNFKDDGFPYSLI